MTSCIEYIVGYTHDVKHDTSEGKLCVIPGSNTETLTVMCTGLSLVSIWQCVPNILKLENADRVVLWIKDGTPVDRWDSPRSEDGASLPRATLP